MSHLSTAPVNISFAVFENWGALSTTAFAVYCELASRQGRNAYCWPSHKTLARGPAGAGAEGKAAYRRVERAVKELEQAGRIQVQRQNGRPNHYRVLPPEQWGGVSTPEGEVTNEQPLSCGGGLHTRGGGVSTPEWVEVTKRSLKRSSAREEKEEQGTEHTSPDTPRTAPKDLIAQALAQMDANAAEMEKGLTRRRRDVYTPRASQARHTGTSAGSADYLAGPAPTAAHENHPHDQNAMH